MTRRWQTNYRCLVLFGAVAAVVSVPVAGQTRRAGDSTAGPTKVWTSPRTAWGDPDLQGIWRSLAQPPLERPKEFAGREFLTDAEVAARELEASERAAKNLAGVGEVRGARGLPLYSAIWGASNEPVRAPRRTSAITDPPNGRLPPWTPAQVKRFEAREAATRGRGEADTVEDRGPSERCFNVVNAGMVNTVIPRDRYDGRFVGAGSDNIGLRRILQAPGYVVIAMEEEEGGDYRIIPLDGRPAPGPKIRQWRGVQRGHWDGKTLLVETTNINDKQNGGPVIPSFETNLYPGSGETLRVIERFTRVDADTIELRYTVDDPETYLRPYTVLRELTRDDGYKVAPAQCHENNQKYMADILAGARADEKGALVRLCQWS